MLCNVELVTVHDLFDLDGLPGGFGGPHLAATEIGVLPRGIRGAEV
jgi:hypothetical protein